jgi:alkylhydroperoxidase family enzyme
VRLSTKKQEENIMRETVARIAPLAPPYAPEVEAALVKWMPPGGALEPLRLFRTLSKHMTLSERMRSLGAAFLGKGTIGVRARELLILRTCARCGAEYEWGVHVSAFSAMAGLDEKAVRATALASPESITGGDDDALLFRLADELHDTSGVSDALWSAVAARWSEAELLEMIALAGFYHLISFTVNAARVEHEGWAASFPRAAPAQAEGAR